MFSIPILEDDELKSWFMDYLNDFRKFKETGKLDDPQLCLQLWEIAHEYAQKLNGYFLMIPAFDLNNREYTFKGLFIRKFDKEDTSRNDSSFVIKVEVDDEEEGAFKLVTYNETLYNEFDLNYSKHSFVGELNFVLRKLYDHHVSHALLYQAEHSTLDKLYSNDAILKCIEENNVVSSYDVCQHLSGSSVFHDLYPICNRGSSDYTTWEKLLHGKINDKYIMEYALLAEAEVLSLCIMNNPEWKQFIDLAIERKLADSEELLNFFNGGFITDEVKAYLSKAA